MNTAIETRALTKVFKGELGEKSFTAVENLSLTIRTGEIFAFLGPNGAGKTTTIKLLTRLIFPTSGNISIMGSDKHSTESLRKVGFLPEQPRFYEYLSGEEFLTLIGHLFQLNRSERESRIELLLDDVGLSGRGRTAIRHYSRGMMQRLGLAQALMNDPDLVILDEPMASLDPIGRKDFRDLILKLKGDGKTIFFSSHILSDAEMVADRVGILNQGKMVTTGDLDDLVNRSTEEIEIIFTMNTEQRAKLNLENAVLQEDKILIRAEGQKETDGWIREITQKGGSVHSVTPRRISLEALFIDRMGGAV